MFIFSSKLHEKSCLAKCIFTGQEWQGEGSYLKAVFLRHFDHCQPTPSSSLCDTPSCHWAHLQHCLHFPSRAPLSFCKTRAQDRMAEKSRGLEHSDRGHLFAQIKKGQAQGTVCTVNLLKKI